MVRMRPGTAGMEMAAVEVPAVVDVASVVIAAVIAEAARLPPAAIVISAAVEIIGRCVAGGQHFSDADGAWSDGDNRPVRTGPDDTRRNPYG